MRQEEHMEFQTKAIISLTHETHCKECGTSEVKLIAGAANVSGYYKVEYMGNDPPSPEETENFLYPLLIADP